MHPPRNGSPGASRTNKEVCRGTSYTTPGTGWRRSFFMTPDQLHACTKKVLADMARKKGLAGWNAMRKDELVAALTPRKSSRPRTKVVRPQPQVSAARNTSASATGEEQVERSKFDVGAPSKD